MAIFDRLFQRKSTEVEPSTRAAVAPSPPFRISTEGMIGEGMWSQCKLGYERNPYVYQCVNIRAGSVSSVPPIIRDKRGDEISDPEHPLNRLLSRPNPRESWAQFTARIETYLGINGNAFVYPIKTSLKGIVELHVLSTEQVMAVRSTSVLEPVLYWQVNLGDKTMRLEPSELVHIRLGTSNDRIYGVSPMYVARINVEMQNSAGLWNKSTLDNGARPSMVVKTAGYLNTEQRETLRDELRNRAQGAENQANVLVTDDQMEVQTLGFSAVDMDFVSGMTMNSRAICVAYGVPSELVGDVANKTYANLSEARSQYAKSCVLPELELIYGELEHFLLPFYPDVAEITYDVGQVQDLGGDQTAMYAAVTNADFLTVNEKRALFGYDDVGADGDVVLTNMSRIPLSEASTAVEPAPMGEGDGLLRGHALRGRVEGRRGPGLPQAGAHPHDAGARPPRVDEVMLRRRTRGPDSAGRPRRAERPARHRERRRHEAQRRGLLDDVSGRSSQADGRPVRRREGVAGRS